MSDETEASPDTKPVSNRAAYQRQYYAKNREKILAQARKRYEASHATQEEQKARVKANRRRIRDGEHVPRAKGTSMLVITTEAGDEVLMEMFTYGGLARVLDPSFKLHRIRHWAKRGFLPKARWLVSTAGHAAYTRDEVQIIQEIYDRQKLVMVQSGISLEWRPTEDFRLEVERHFAERLDASGVRR